MILWMCAMKSGAENRLPFNQLQGAQLGTEFRVVYPY
jgi:hypothetical protein